MSYMPASPRLARRTFLVGAAAGGLSLGFAVPFVPGSAEAAETEPEVNAWVVIKPDDTIIIRIARSEMGQGTLTGLAQLVAEELECDWSKVTTEYPTPGQSVARKRAWGDMSTGGSRGIRTSHDYVRKGGKMEAERESTACHGGRVDHEPAPRGILHALLPALAVRIMPAALCTAARMRW